MTQQETENSHNLQQEELDLQNEKKYENDESFKKMIQLDNQVLRNKIEEKHNERQRQVAAENKYK